MTQHGASANVVANSSWRITRLGG